MEAVKTLFSVDCYKSPWPVFPEQTGEHRAYYNPYIDAYFRPRPGFAEGEVLSDLFETGHRTLTMTRSQCFMRFLASCIYCCVFIVYLRGKEDSYPLSKTVRRLQKDLHIAFNSTLYVEESWSLLTTIDNLRRRQKELKVKNIDRKQKEALWFLENEEGLRGFSTLYGRLAELHRVLGQRTVEFLVFDALNALPPLDVMFARDPEFPEFDQRTSDHGEREDMSPTSRLHKTLSLVERLIKRVSPQKVARLDASSLGQLLQEQIRGFDPNCADTFCFWDSESTDQSATLSNSSYPKQMMRDLCKYICEGQQKVGKELAYFVGLDRDTVLKEWYVPLLVFVSSESVGIKPLTIFNKLHLVQLVFFESLRQQIHMQQGLLCPFQGYVCGKCGEFKHFVRQVWNALGQGAFVKGWEKPPCLEN